MSTGARLHGLEHAAATEGQVQVQPSGPLSSESQSGVSPHEEGFDFEFVPPLGAQYECPICTLILRDPIQTTCGHRFCKVCINKWIRERQSQTRCPSCQTPLKPRDTYPDNFAKREVLASTVRCPNYSQGCTTIIELGRHQDHVDRCEFSPVMCTKTCGIVILRKNLAHHLQRECPNRQTVCPFCKVEYMLSKSQEHLRHCQEAQVPCEHCQKPFPRNMMDSHVIYCPDVIIDCPITRCNQKIKRRSVFQHIREKILEHVLYVNEAVAILTQLLGIPQHVFDYKTEDPSFPGVENLLSAASSDLSLASESLSTSYGSATNLSNLASNINSASIGGRLGPPFDMSKLSAALTPAIQQHNLVVSSIDSSTAGALTSVTTAASSDLPSQYSQSATASETTRISESVDELKDTINKLQKQFSDLEKEFKETKKKKVPTATRR